MKTLLALFFIMITVGVPVVAGQSVKTRRGCISGRIRKSLPTVSLNIVKYVEKGDYFLLVLRNNSPWRLHLYLTPESVPNGLPILFNVESDADLPSLSAWSGDVVFNTTIKSGRQVELIVERKYLAKGYSIYVPFHYEFELNKAETADPFRGEPSHRLVVGHWDALNFESSPVSPVRSTRKRR